MTEEEAECWIGRQVSRETKLDLDRFVTLLLAENQRQNLIGKPTENAIRARHIVDSLQLANFTAVRNGWLDLGSGAGLPGIPLALSGIDITMVESRGLRCKWLEDMLAEFPSAPASLLASRLENIPGRAFSVITARAFAPLSQLFALAHRFSTPETQWILPKGKSARDELAGIAGTWHGDFAMTPSLTDPSAAIVTARNVRPARRARR